MSYVDDSFSDLDQRIVDRILSELPGYMETLLIEDRERVSRLRSARSRRIPRSSSKGSKPSFREWRPEMSGQKHWSTRVSSLPKYQATFPSRGDTHLLSTRRDITAWVSGADRKKKPGFRVRVR
ncbi:MAG: hypothetical protein ACQGVK_04160 [Myxococcota bacterium]